MSLPTSMFSQSTRAIPRLSNVFCSASRSYSSSTPSSSHFFDSDLEPLPKRSRETKRVTPADILPEKSNARYTAKIRTYKHINSAVGVWTLKNALERKYGPVLDIRFLKDYEQPKMYQLLAYVAFRDSASLQRVPERGEEFTVPIAIRKDKLKHEVRLSDLLNAFGNSEHVPGFQFEEVRNPEYEESIGGVIVRAETDFSDISDMERPIHQSTPLRTMEDFLSWNGFAPLDDIDVPKISLADLSSPDAEKKQLHMRAALEMCAKYTGRRGSVRETLGSDKTRSASHPDSSQAPESSDTPLTSETASDSSPEQYDLPHASQAAKLLPNSMTSTRRRKQAKPFVNIPHKNKKVEHNSSMLHSAPEEEGSKRKSALGKLWDIVEK